MILTYYQSVELMTFLPVLLSVSDAKTNKENLSGNIAEHTVEEDTNGIYQMWNTPSSGMEVNGAAFY